MKKGPPGCKTILGRKRREPRPWGRAGGRLLNPVSRQTTKSKTFLEAAEIADENKGFYHVGNRAKHSRICFVF